MLQWRYDIESVLDVPPSAFDPPPRVDSAVVRMVPLPQPAGVDAALLGEMVAVAFSQRRKLLRHTLGRWLDERGFGGDFDVQRRAEEVPVAEYVALRARAMRPASGAGRGRSQLGGLTLERALRRRSATSRCRRRCSSAACSCRSCCSRRSCSAVLTGLSADALGHFRRPLP